MKQEVRPIVVALSAWLCLAFSVAIGGSFHNASAPAVAATVWILTGLALFACWRIPAIRQSLPVLDLRWLLSVHLTRFVGIYFLILANRGDLPHGFAQAAGIGDIAIAIGAAALLFTLRRDGVLQRPYQKRLLAGWNTFGLLDIVFVVFSALRFGLKDWLSMAPLRELPLSLLPTFVVPLIIVSHVLIFIRLKVDAASSGVIK
jgi:hypothetical protein